MRPLILLASSISAAVQGAGLGSAALLGVCLVVLAESRGQVLLELPVNRISFFFYFKFIYLFLLKDNCFTVFCWFLPNTNNSQS